MTLKEYFAQDILDRIDQARLAMDEMNDDPILFEADGVGIQASDVLHDAHLIIRKLREQCNQSL